MMLSIRFADMYNKVKTINIINNERNQVGIYRLR